MRPIDVDHKLEELEDRIRSPEKDSTALAKAQASMINRFIEQIDVWKNSYVLLWESMKDILNDPKQKELN